MTQTPIEKLSEAVQTFINEIAEEPLMVRGSAVVAETMHFHDDQPCYNLHYMSLRDTSPAEMVGLLSQALFNLNCDLNN